MDAVEQWRGALYPIRLSLGLQTCTYPDRVILSLIHVESAGDPSAHRGGSQYYGLLQMGRMAGLDADISDTSLLHGDGHAAIRAFLVYQERYKHLHCYQPSRVAFLWKAGPGTLKRANELIAQDGLSQDAAFEQAAKEKKVPNAMEYLRRFRQAMGVYHD